MTPKLSRLIEIEPPPSTPSEAGSIGAWLEIEHECGIGFPNDYEEMIAVYGAGEWFGFLGFYSPFYKWKHPLAAGFKQWVTTRLNGLNEMHTVFPELAPLF